MADSDGHVQVRFTCKIEKYKVNDHPFSLPDTVDRNALNSLINSLLKDNDDDDEKEKQFTFMINGKFVNVVLQEFIKQHEILTEDVIEIEYTIQEDAPKLNLSLPHADWVSTVDYLDGYVLSGSYDNVCSIWSPSGELLEANADHTKPVKAVSWIQKDKKEYTFLTAGQDQLIYSWKWKPTAKVACCFVYRGHAGSVDCLAVSPNSKQFASGSWDSMVKVWSLSDDESLSEESLAPKENKRQKSSGKDVPTKVPLQTMAGHKEAVSSILWTDDHSVATAGWDHCIRLWDVSIGVNSQTLTGSKVFTSLAYSKERKLFATGSNDRHVRLWDPQSKDGRLVQSMLTHHKGWISSVSWSPTNQHQLASSSFDNNVLIWDIRSIDQPLHKLTEHIDKVLCSSWREPNVLVTGGADNLVTTHHI